MSRKPNIVMFCTDHQRADYLGCAGHPLIKTPNLDRLAAMGVRFDNLYVQGAVCMPSRASIMTGTYPCRHTVTDNGYNLPEHMTTIADVLAENDYQTMVVGRTHIVCTQPRPEYPKSGFYGFNKCAHTQVYCGNTDPNNDYLDWIREEHPEHYEAIAFANEHCSPAFPGDHTDVPEELSMTSWVGSKTCEFIREHQANFPDNPFMIWAGTWDPHSPYRAPEPWGSMYDPDDVPLPKKTEEELATYPEGLRRLATTQWWRDKDMPIDEVMQRATAMYMGMVSHIDDQLGRILDTLEQEGILDETIVLFTSDHGDMLGEHWFQAKRIFCYDGALKVPGIIAGPGVPRGKEVSALVESVDIMPTLLELSGMETPRQVQGKSWVPLFSGEEEVLHENVYTEQQYHSTPPNSDEDTANDEHIFSIYDGRYRIVTFARREYGQLFDFETDPDNFINQWDNPDYAEIKNRMLNKLLYRMMDNLHQPETRLAHW